MSKFIVVSLLMLLVIVNFFSCTESKVAPAKEIAKTLVAQVDSFAAICTIFKDAVEVGSSERDLQQLFLDARLTYKKFEWAAEYFEPSTSRSVNGPPVQEVEPSGQTFEPAGLQVVEGLLFPRYDATGNNELIKQLAAVISRCARYKAHFTNIDILDWQVLDAAKLEVFRIEALGISGFDNPLTLNSTNESAIGLRSIAKAISYYDKDNSVSLTTKIEAANDYLLHHHDFNTFNRALFIVRYCNPISTSITILEDKLKTRVIRYNRLLNQEAKTLFDSNAFNVNAYSPGQYAFVDAKKIVLGRKLFSDPVLSGDNNRSCQSCHRPDKAFTDGLAKNTVITGSGLLKRNTPTLINAALQSAQFYDLRVNTLEDQSLDVVQNSVEMHGSMKLSVKRLWSDTIYQKMFSEAFPRNNRTGIDTLEVMNAIASYVRSLSLLNSRFDDYMRGDSSAMNNDEVNGFNLFMGKAKCGTCHYMPLFNGTFPPRYMRTEAEVIGVPKSLAVKEIDDDLGRYDVIKVESLKHAFKTPTLRNAALTTPYMHNGIYESLEQVMDFYNKGGGVGLGLEIANQTLSADRLNLTEKEIGEVTAFVKALNSR